MDSTEELEQSAHMAIVVEEQMFLHVTNVSDNTSVFQTFSKYGKNIWLRKVEFVSMGTRSYLIAFRDEKDGEKATREMNGIRFKGNHWKITRTQLSESRQLKRIFYVIGTLSIVGFVTCFHIADEKRECTVIDKMKKLRCWIIWSSVPQRQWKE
jgi:hypothetical protein